MREWILDNEGEGSERSAGIDAAWEDGHEIVESDIAGIEWDTRRGCLWTIRKGIGRPRVLPKEWLARGRLMATPERIRAQRCFSATHRSRSGDGI